MRAGIAVAFVVATLITLVIAWPVVRSPTSEIYGHEIVGRHYDAYTVMWQIGGSSTSGPYAQPVTDRLGWLFARVMHPVAAYNLLVLLSFPLTAAATYALARRLTGSHTASLIAAAAFTFAPLRLAHAAYHPHIVQTHWIPLYLIALFALVDRPSWFRVSIVSLACAALALSNFYAGLIGAVITPVALLTHWYAQPDRRQRSLVLASTAMIGIAAVGIGLIALKQPQLIAQPSTFAFQPQGLGEYRARWWAYFVPPVDHPIAGAWAGRVFARAGVTSSLVEEQVYVSYGLLALAIAGIAGAYRRRCSEPQGRAVLSIAAVGVAAWLISLGPLSGSCEPSSWAPACLIYGIAPMFRAYARFALVAHLAVAIAAGAGAVMLERRSPGGVVMATCLLLLAGFEYWPLPWRSHDVLPTAGHRWLADRPEATHVFDCAKGDPSLFTIPWLMQRSVSFASDASTCADPQLGGRLSALGYTHLVTRRAQDSAGPPETAAWLKMVEEFADARVYIVQQPPPPVVTIDSHGFFGFEHEDDNWWRWMGAEGRWAVRNTTKEPRTVSLVMRLLSDRDPRTLTLALDNDPAGRFELGTTGIEITAGPWTLAPGDHVFAFSATPPPIRPADDGRSTDTRARSVMFRDERWVE